MTTGEHHPAYLIQYAEFLSPSGYIYKSEGPLAGELGKATSSLDGILWVPLGLSLLLSCMGSGVFHNSRDRAHGRRCRIKTLFPVL